MLGRRNKRKSMKKIRENNGEFTIKGAVILLVVAILLVFSVSVMGAVNSKSKLDSISNQLARYVSIRGAVDADVLIEQRRLITNSGLDCTVTVNATYIQGTGQIQFGDPFTVVVEYPTKFGVGGILAMPVTIRSKDEGRSEVYWKR